MMTDKETGDCYLAEPMHYECLACHAVAAGQVEPGGETITLLSVMVAHELDWQDLRDGLCFHHRRIVDDTAAKVLEALSHGS